MENGKLMFDGLTINMTTPFDSSIKEILFVKIDVSIQPC